MSAPQWENLPTPPTSGWSGFAHDPRNPQFGTLRASDADRDNAASMLGTAYAEGRLDRDEYDQRVDQAMSSKTLGELVPVLADLVPAADQQSPRQDQPAGYGSPAAASRGFRNVMPRGWIALAVLFNVIWLMTCLTSGRLLYYWPMWPMLGTAIPMLLGSIWASGRVRSRDRDRRQIPPPPAEQDLR